MDLAVTHIKETVSRNQLVSGSPDIGSGVPPGILQCIP